MRTVDVLAAAVAIASWLIPATADAHTFSYPAAVVADPAGYASYEIVLRFENFPDQIVTGRYGGTGICISAVGDGDCDFLFAPGDSIRDRVETRLCNPEVAGRSRVRYDLCWGEKDTLFTDILPYSTASTAEPVAVALSLRNHPNPVRGRTTFQISLPAAGHVSLRVYDLLGRRVAQPIDEVRTAGSHAIDWNPAGSSGAMLSPGVYLARLDSGGRSATHRFVIAN